QSLGPAGFRHVPGTVPRTRRLQARARKLADAGGALVHQVSVYSGPLPPSGGVSRPPFAVIAPHWTQLEGVMFTPLSDGSYTCAGHMRVHSSAMSFGTSRRTRMWPGWSSRVLLPEAKTDESLSKVSFPSAAG